MLTLKDHREDGEDVQMLGWAGAGGRERLEGGPSAGLQTPSCRHLIFRSA